MANGKKYTRQMGFTEAFNKLKTNGEFLFDDLAKEIDKLLVKKIKGAKSNIDMAREEAKRGLVYVEELGLARQEIIHKIIVKG